MTNGRRIDAECHLLTWRYEGGRHVPYCAHSTARPRPTKIDSCPMRCEVRARYYEDARRERVAMDDEWGQVT